uniref:Transcription factor IIIC 90kDa subunit N-terminal domain-containing protein n=1 Tax=Cyprinus carpio TaxID=7962 RepID=A0A8C1M1F7_CYPCA
MTALNSSSISEKVVVLRDPAIKLLSPVTGLEPLSWAEDHRLAASSTNSVSIMELMCDIHSLSQNLVLHRSHIPVPDIACDLKVTTARHKLNVNMSKFVINNFISFNNCS